MFPLNVDTDIKKAAIIFSMKIETHLALSKIHTTH